MEARFSEAQLSLTQIEELPLLDIARDSKRSIS